MGSVPWPGIKPRPCTLEVWSLSKWTTREVPKTFTYENDSLLSLRPAWSGSPQLSNFPFCLLHHTQAKLAFLLLRFTSLISVLGNLFLLFLLPEICVSRFFVRLSSYRSAQMSQLFCDHSCHSRWLTEWSGLWYSRVENLRLRYTPRMLSRIWLFCDSMDCNPPGFSVHGTPGKSTGVGCHFLIQKIHSLSLGKEVCNGFPAWNLTDSEILGCHLLYTNAILGQDSTLLGARIYT